MERMNAVEEVDISAGVAIAQAGTPLQKLQERVEQHGLMFPLDLGARGSCTIGGNISTNAGGNRVIRYGMTRELVLGLEVVAGRRHRAERPAQIHQEQHRHRPEASVHRQRRHPRRGDACRAAASFRRLAERQVALCALPSFGQVVSLLKLARRHLGGELTAFEVMWNEYYRLTVERVKGVTGPLPTHHPFYVLFEASGADAERIHADLEKLLEKALGDNLILDATLSTSNASAAAMWRIRNSSVELGRSFPYRRTNRLRRQPRHRPDGAICRYDRRAHQGDRSAGVCRRVRPRR